jgi:hypothetical protein
VNEPNDAERIIRALCEKYGVPLDFGLRLTPLVARAQKSPADARRRIMEMVERSFAQEAVSRVEDSSEEDPGADLRLLKTVAQLLHDWRPPPWLDGWKSARS